jgi:hypothetical protein
MLMKIIYLCLTIILYVYFPHHFNLVKNILQNIGIKLAYNIIYFYGVCQIKCNQLYNYTFPYLKNYIFSFMSIKDEPTTPIEVFNIITNKIVYEKEYEEAINKIMELNKLKENVIIVTEPSHINKKILYELETWNNQFETSDITFIALYLNYDDVRYHINLKTDKYNYYLIGNVINKLFLQYYVNVILNNINFVIDDKKSYSLELMDHEVNMIYLDITQSIIIEKNGYHINTIKVEDIKVEDIKVEDIK